MGKTNRSPAQRAAMKHNSLIGLAACIQKHATTIATASTVTEESRTWAEDIRFRAKTLEQALRAGRKS